jgi:putative membrane protein
MTYFGVLLVFIVPPLLLALWWLRQPLLAWVTRNAPRDKNLPFWILLLHVFIALLYTTPWDNYLVASGVWWYDLNLVTGLTLGWVPIEEYTFFALQTLLTGLWTLGLMHFVFLRPETVKDRPAVRFYLSLVVGLLWVSSLAILWLAWMPARYLGLILVWALPPIWLQLAFGADILLSRLRFLLTAILPTTIYLWMVDALAIRFGTWTIDPQQTTGLGLAGLPIEEMLFFLVTNVLVVFGITLMLSAYSHQRVAGWRRRLLPTNEVQTGNFNS